MQPISGVDNSSNDRDEILYKELSMKIMNFILGFAGTALLSIGLQAAETATSVYNVDTAASSVQWIGKKILGQHNGTVTLKTGRIEVAGGKIMGGKFEIDMTSIKNLDLTDAKKNGDLTGHLKSDDFFGVEKHPISSFTIKSVKPGKDGTTELSGDLMIKGVTEPYSFPAKVELKDSLLTLTAALKIDRTKFNVRYGSNKFFDNLGNKAINNEFDLDVKVIAKAEAVKAPESKPASISNTSTNKPKSK